MDAVQAAKQSGDVAFRKNKYTDAVEAYSKALQLSEQAQEPELLHLLYSNRAAAKLQLQDYKGALADAQASVAVNESWVKGWYRSAKALQGLGRLDMALQAATKAQQLEPNNSDVGQLLRQLTMQLGNQQQQQQQEPSSVDSQQRQGRHVSGPGQLDGAVDKQEQLLQQQQQHQDVLKLPWKQLNVMRSKLDLKRLPPGLVAGSRYLPSPDGINHNLLLLLHGLGDKPAAFTGLAQRMCLPQTACLALSGPLVVPETDGGRAWFTAFDDEGELIQPGPGETRRIKSLQATISLLEQLLFEALPAVGGWRPAEIQLLGFSQGGCVALTLASKCQHDRQLGGVVAVSAGLLDEALLQQERNASSCQQGENVSTPVLITYGDQDQVVHRERVDRTASALKAAGCPVELKVFKGKGHAMINSQEEMRLTLQFWAQHLKHRPVDPDFVEVE